MKNKKVMILNNYKLLSTLIAASLSATSATQAAEISTFIPSAKTESYKENPSNLWFILDNSGSMSQRSIYSTSSISITNGFVPYNPQITYKLPKRIDGSDMPLPASNLFGTPTYWDNPFRDDSKGKNRWTRYRNIWYARKKRNCDKTDRNCHIWANFYRTRLFTLKSSLSLVFNNEVNKKYLKNIRLGYRSLSNRDVEILPVAPLGGDTGEENQKQFNKWLYALTSGGVTPLRGKMAGTVHDIVEASKSKSNVNNPFLENPGQSYDKDKNKILSCRRNYMLVLTDGGWNRETNNSVDNLLSGSIKSSTLVENDTFPDGRAYYPRAPYKRTFTARQTRTLADIAFSGWKTDLDNKASNNDFLPKNRKINGKVQTLGGKEYWHPYNNPASWQSLTTYTIGYGLNNSSKVHINPPNGVGKNGIKNNYLQDWWAWDIRTGFEGQKAYIGDNSIVADLANAALAGRGLFYDVQTSDDMNDAFDSIFKDVGGGKVESKPTVTGSSGSVGVSQDNGGSRYSTWYDVESNTGSIKRTNLFDGLNPEKCFTKTPEAKRKIGSLCDTPVWDAAKKLKELPVTSRNIFSLQRTNKTNELTKADTGSLKLEDLKYKSIEFTVDNLSDYQEKMLITNFSEVLKDNFSGETDITRLEKLFGYVRGNSAHESDIFRDRSIFTYADGTKGRNTLGSIVRSAPAYAGVPNSYDTSNLTRGGNAYNSYLTFVSSFVKDNSKGKKEVVYIASNDGMLHALRANTGEELFAYVPSSIYKNLPKTVVPGKSVTLIDGALKLATVNFGNGVTSSDNDENADWNRVLLGGFGAGGNGLFSLNITTPTKEGVMDNDKAKWEYSDLESIVYQKEKSKPTGLISIKSNVGNIMGEPVIVQLQDNTWVAITGNGYNSASNKAVLLVIDLKTGKPIQELELAGDITKDNGLGPVSVTAYPNKVAGEKHLYDRAYAGDLQGNLWVFDLKGSNKIDGVKLAGSGKPLFTATNGGVAQPITVAPLVDTHPYNYGKLIHFGTGSLFSRDDQSSKVTNSIYAIWDDWIKKEDRGLPTPRTDNTVKINELYKVKIDRKEVDVIVNGKSTKKVIRNLVPDEQLAGKPKSLKWQFRDSSGYRGWKIDLPAGERAWQHAQLRMASEGELAVSYKTANYHSGKNKTEDKVSGALSCKTKGGDVRTAEVVFSVRDPSKKLRGFGAIDINEDGVVDSKDTSSNGGSAISGYEDNSGGILLNGVDAVVDDKGKNKKISGNCKIVETIITDSTGNDKDTQFQVCSSFSSWKELK